MDNQNIQQNHNEKILTATAVICLVMLVVIFVLMYTRSHYRKVDDIMLPIVQNTPAEPAQLKQNFFEGLNLSAKAAVVWDTRKKEFVYKKSEKDILPLASLTKLMTALAAKELLPAQSQIQIVDEYSKDGADPQLPSDENWQTDDLVSLTLLSSSNVGARAIASVAGTFLVDKENTLVKPEETFIAYLNKRATKIGLKSTHFYNDSGLDVNLEKSGAYGSAEDMAKLVEYILENQSDILESTKYSKLEIVSADNNIHNVKNTNTIVDNIPGVLGSKTGYTDLAQGNLIIAFSPGLEGPYIAVVLGSTYDGRFTDMNSLVSATLKNLEQ